MLEHLYRRSNQPASMLHMIRPTANRALEATGGSVKRDAYAAERTKAAEQIIREDRAATEANLVCVCVCVCVCAGVVCWDRYCDHL